MVSSAGKNVLRSWGAMHGSVVPGAGVHVPVYDGGKWFFAILTLLIVKEPGK